jgi:hypothetical protein
MLLPASNLLPGPSLLPGADLVQVEVPNLAPSLDEVALLLRTRTVGGQMQGGLGSDTGPADLTTFGPNTRPTDTEVERLITTAYGVIEGQIAGGVDDLADNLRGLVRHTMALYAAVLVEVSFFRETSDDTLIAMWRDMIQTNLLAIAASIDDYAGDVRKPTFGTLTIGTIRYPVPGVPEPDYMQGIDFP